VSIQNLTVVQSRAISTMAVRLQTDCCFNYDDYKKA